MKMIAAILLCLCSLTGLAQKEDYTWLAGYLTQNYDSGFGKWIGECRFDFNQNPVAISLDSMGINFRRSNSMISDADGNLLFSCNGVRVHNRFDEMIPGTDTLGNVDGATWFTFVATSAYALGIAAPQYHVSIPNPIVTDHYDIFHALLDTFHVPNGTSTDGTKILRTTIDIHANSGHGITIRKDEVILSHENNAGVLAVKHGNGKDWWICTNQTFSNCYSFLYYNGLDATFTHSQCAGGISERGEYVYTRFSQDGIWFASVAYTGLNIFNFNRCDGTLNFKEHIPIPEFIDSMQWRPTSIEFSPNGRFLYLLSTYRIYQYDLWENNISSTKKVVAIYNPQFGCPFRQFFDMAQLAPDGKIYISSGNTNFCLAIINNPDEEGSQCNFVPYGLDLPNFISGIPHFPNYRLGALPGSPCDTITGIKEIAEKEKLLKIFPNPAADVATIDYGYTDWSKGEATMEIANNLGQVVHSQTLPMYSGFQKLEVGKYPSGAYTVYIKRKGSIVATGYLVKE